MSEVFLSYKAEDRARLKPLVAALEADGCHVWWDAHIGGGTDWREEIQDHLDAARCVIVAWSEGSVGHDGSFVRDEAGRAREHHTYLPICIDAVKPPLGFGEQQAIQLQGWKGNRKDPRYQALLTAVRARLAGEAPPPIPAGLAPPRISRRVAIAGGAAGLAAVAGGGWVVFGGGKAQAPKRIAVMPFANLSGDPAQAYFSDGIAEELRGALSRIGLEVIGRTSSDAVRELDATKAAAKLGVANILTGSVRRSTQTIRIGAQLVGGDDGVERWAQSYDRAPGDAIKIQTDIAANVAQALSIVLGQVGRAALTLGGTADSVAQDFILQSRKLTGEGGGAEAIRKSIALASDAIARDPGYAGAYVEKADALARLAANYPSTPAEAANQLAEADAAARRAIAIAPRLGSAYAALAGVEVTRLQFADALQQIKQALALSPEDPFVLAEAVWDLAYLGDAREALGLAERFIALDPLNARAYDRKGRALMVLRRYPQAIEAGRKALQLAPNRFNTYYLIGDSLTLSRQYAAARAEYQAMPADDPFRLTGEAIVAARTGDSAGAKRTMSRLKQLFSAGMSYQYSQINVQLGDVDGAFAELDNAMAAKDPGLMLLKTDPFLDPIRPDPRFAALLKRLKFP